MSLSPLPPRTDSSGPYWSILETFGKGVGLAALSKREEASPKSILLVLISVCQFFKMETYIIYTSKYQRRFADAIYIYCSLDWGDWH